MCRFLSEKFNIRNEIFKWRNHLALFTISCCVRGPPRAKCIIMLMGEVLQAISGDGVGASYAPANDAVNSCFCEINWKLDGRSSSRNEKNRSFWWMWRACIVRETRCGSAAAAAFSSSRDITLIRLPKWNFCVETLTVTFAGNGVTSFSFSWRKIVLFDRVSFRMQVRCKWQYGGKGSTVKFSALKCIVTLLNLHT